MARSGQWGTGAQGEQKDLPAQGPIADGDYSASTAQPTSEGLNLGIFGAQLTEPQWLDGHFQVTVKGGAVTLVRVRASN